jgi:BirA family biotin operon repressor/biotin-[acetyl-CoA-carboxylase] ligase
MRRIHYDIIDSTNSEARRLAEMHPGERLLVTAATQSAGRGRQGRVWHSPRGGAWLSLVWPVGREPRTYLPVSLVAAAALRRAVMKLAGHALGHLCIKWPNDLLIADKKVAGILCELFPVGSAAHRGGVLVIGIGVNVDFDLALLAADLRHPATTLRAALGRPVDVEDVIVDVARHVCDSMEVFEREGLNEKLLDELRVNLAYVGSVRTWNSPQGAVTGTVLGVDDCGRLMLKCGTDEVTCEFGEFAAVGSVLGRDAATPDSPGRRPG